MSDVTILRAERWADVETGESFTPCMGSGRPSGPPGPPMSMFSSMSIRPGRSVTSPRSTSAAGPGSSFGLTATIWFPSTTTTAGPRTSPVSTSAQRSALSTVTSLMEPPRSGFVVPVSSRLCRRGQGQRIGSSALMVVRCSSRADAGS